MNNVTYLTDTPVDSKSENGLRIVLSPVQLAAILSDIRIYRDKI